MGTSAFQAGFNAVTGAGGGGRRQKKKQDDSDLEPQKGEPQGSITNPLSTQSLIKASLAKTPLQNLPVLGARKKGGRIRKTGLYKLHAGETVIPASKRRSGKKGYSKLRTIVKP